MKVIKSGKGWNKRVTCKGCEAVLEAGSEDVHHEVTDEDARSQQYENEVEGSYFIICPECEQQTKIKSKDIPENIREYLRSR